MVHGCSVAVLESLEKADTFSKKTVQVLTNDCQSVVLFESTVVAVTELRPSAAETDSARLLNVTLLGDHALSPGEEQHLQEQRG